MLSKYRLPARSGYGSTTASPYVFAQSRGASTLSPSYGSASSRHSSSPMA